jgi:hypothetical protein
MKRFKYLFALYVFAVTVFLRTTPVLAGDPLVSHLQKTIKAGEIFHIIEELSSHKYQGRLTGTEGYNKAAQWAADFFKTHHVKPLFKTYFQQWPLSYTKVYEAALHITFKNKEGNEKIIAGKYFDNFYPLGFSAGGDVTAEIVFTGFGITAPEYNYDDYKDIDVKGKIVMVTGGVPKRKKDEDWTAYSYYRHRTQNAKKHGAAGLLVIRQTLATPNGDYIPDFPMVSIAAKAADDIFALKELDTRKLRASLRERENVSYATGVNAHITVKSENFKGKGLNIVGVVEGSDPQLKNEFIVLGGHLDHCGSWPVLTPGAEDNGSGSASVLTAAKAIASLNPKPKRSFIFILFGGEEMGLLGSRYFVSHLPSSVAAGNIKFMFNLDMVSAGPNTFIMGMKNHPHFEKLAYEAKDALQLKLKLTGNKVNPPLRPNADYYAFAEKGIPAVSWFSGGGDHHGYHSNTDTIYWITPKIAESIVRMACYSGVKLADKTE